MKIIISGGGIGGLTAALCCLHHGHEVTVLEAAPELSEVGAGIQLPPNAMKVFAALGLEDLIVERAFRPEALEARMGVSGRFLFSIPLNGRTHKRWGAPYMHLHRADYIYALERALADKSAGIIKLGHKVASYSQSDDKVDVKLADGTQVQGDILIGADGIHSAIRAQMLGAETPAYTGNIAWRTVVPVDKLGDAAPRPAACVWMGRGRHCATYLLRGGELANLVAVVEKDEWKSESWTEQGSREEALKDFAGWHPTITRILEQSDTLFRWALFARAPLKTWTDGRVALLGDAAHPMLPFMAQGAAMAVEDAWALAKQLSQHSLSAGAALQVYQAIRYDRASKVQALSKANAKTFHQQTLAGQLKTYAPMWLAGRILPGAIVRRQDALYKYDVTKT